MKQGHNTVDRWHGLLLLMLTISLCPGPAPAQILEGSVYTYYADGSDVPDHNDILRELILNQEVRKPMDFRDPPVNPRFEPANVYGFGNDDGRVYLGLVTGTSLKATEARRGVAGRGDLFFESKVYVASSDSGIATYTITPSWLEIYSALEQHSASLLLLVDLCRLDAGEYGDCWRQAFLFAKLTGANGTVANHTYRMSALTRTQVLPEGELTLDIFDCSACTDANGNPLPMSEWPVEGARYDFPRFTGNLDLSVLTVGDEFVVIYELEVFGRAPNGIESGVKAFIGDPLDVDAGISLETGPGVEPTDATRGSSRICNAGLPLVTPSARFLVHEDATVTDLDTGLNWLRCPQGFALDEGTSADPSDDACVAVGPTAFSWQAALQEATAASGTLPAGSDGWRLPNAKELASIVETACAFPARNTMVFPAIDNDMTWSSTPGDFGVAWNVDFGAGNLRSASQLLELGARLVRDAGVVQPPVEDEVFADGFE